MTVEKVRPMLGLVGLLALATACEPANILEARDQLGRGGERTIEFALPLIDTVFKIETLLEDSDIDTTAAGLLAVEIEPESVSVGFGEELVFENIELDTTVVNFPPGALTVPSGTQIPFTVVNAGLDSDTILENVDTVTIYSGNIAVTTRNRLPVPVTYTVTLNGFDQVGGGPVIGSGTVSAAPGNGSYANDVLNFDLAGVTIVPDSVTVDISGSVTVGGSPIPPALGDSAIVQTGVIASVQVQSASGPLDPTLTPELTVSVEEVEEILRSDFDLGDLEDAIEESTINDATIFLTLGNGSGVLVALTDFNLGVVTLDAVGNVPRDAFGNPVFEEDAGGNPILVAVTDPAQTTATLPSMGTTNLELNAAPLLDRLVHLLLDDERAAIVAAGSAVVGDSSQARVTRTDSVSVAMGMTLGLDFTIPPAGVTFTRNTTSDGAELDDEDADQLVERLDSAGVFTEVVNHTPFGVEIDIAFVEDSLGEDVDIFAQPNAVVLNTISLPAPTVDAQGLVTTAGSSSVSILLTGTQARQLLGLKFSAGARSRLLPGTGAAGRGAIRATDEVTLDSRVHIALRAGGTQ